MEPSLLRVKEAAQILNVSTWTIYRWIEEGRLEATKIGRGSLRIFHESVTALIEGNRMEQSEAHLISSGRIVRLTAASARKKK